MKKAKSFLSVFIILMIVGGALAWKANSLFGPAGVFCSSTCSVKSLIGYKPDSSGTVTAPCGEGVQPYLFKADPVNSCVPAPKGTRFSPVSFSPVPGGN